MNMLRQTKDTLIFVSSHQPNTKAEHRELEVIENLGFVCLYPGDFQRHLEDKLREFSIIRDIGHYTLQDENLQDARRSIWCIIPPTREP